MKEDRRRCHILEERKTKTRVRSQDLVPWAYPAHQDSPGGLPRGYRRTLAETGVTGSFSGWTHKKPFLCYNCAWLLVEWPENGQASLSVHTAAPHADLHFLTPDQHLPPEQVLEGLRLKLKTPYNIASEDPEYRFYHILGQPSPNSRGENQEKS